MHYRTLGRTGLRISEIGYGAWGIGNSGWQGASDEESARALNRAIDLGLTFIDTALGYGDGHSERLIGKLLRERSGDDLRLDQDPAEEPDMAGPSGHAGRGRFPRRSRHRLH
ncbi:aryl-alcohol dehydrogenase-like predicted oxidoreductase [Sinorhizobium fredii]